MSERTRTACGALLALCAAALALAAVASAADGPNDSGEAELSGTREGTQRVAAARVWVHDATLADVFAAGGEVAFDRVAGDDVFVAGGSLRLRELNVEDLAGVGGELEVQARIADDLLAAGGRIRLDPDTVVRGDAVLAAGDLEIDGRVEGNVTAAAGRVVLAGVVGGDVDLAVAELVVAPGARVSGELVYRSGESARISPQAVIDGGVRHERTPLPHPSAWAVAGLGLGALVVLITGLALMAAVVQAVLPRAVHGAVGQLRARPWPSWLVGFGLVVAVPFAANILLVTVVGIPLGLLVYALYATGLALGAVVAGAWLGRRVTRTTGAPSGSLFAASAPWRTALGMAVLSLLGVVPVLGWLMLLAAVPLGAGALARQSRQWVLAGAPDTTEPASG